MKFTVDRDVFAAAAAAAARTTPRAPGLPVLAGIRVTATDDHVALAAFDYGQSVTLTVDAPAATPGEILAPRVLADIAHALPRGGQVDVALEGSRVRVTCGAATYTLLTLPLEDYPTLPSAPPTLGEVDAGAFATAVQRTIVAASRGAALPALEFARVRLTATEIVLEATDRYRAASAHLPWQPGDGFTEDIEVNIYAGTLAEIAKTLPDGPLGIGVSDDGNLVGFTAPTRRLVTNAGDKPLPVLDALWPDTQRHVEVDAAALREAIKRVSLVAERNTPIRLTATGDVLTVEAGTGDEAQAVETLPCTLTGGAFAGAAFNPQFLTDGAAAVLSDTVRLALTTETKPWVLTAPDDPAYRYLLMPIRP